MTSRKLKFWGWGFEDTLLTANEIALLEGNYAKHLGMSGFQATPAPKAEEISLRKPRLEIPSSLQNFARRIITNACYTATANRFSIARARSLANFPIRRTLSRCRATSKTSLTCSIGAAAKMRSRFRSAAAPASSAALSRLPEISADRPVVTIDLRNLESSSRNR